LFSRRKRRGESSRIGGRQVEARRGKKERKRREKKKKKKERRGIQDSFRGPRVEGEVGLQRQQQQGERWGMMMVGQRCVSPGV
jgi:hypothetical protein